MGGGVPSGPEVVSLPTSFNVPRTSSRVNCNSDARVGEPVCGISGNVYKKDKNFSSKFDQSAKFLFLIKEIY